MKPSTYLDLGFVLGATAMASAFGFVPSLADRFFGVLPHIPVTVLYVTFVLAMGVNWWLYRKAKREV